MRIALVSPYDFAHPGGVTNHVASLAHQLMRMDHQVKILTPLSNTRVQQLNEHVVPLGRPVPIRSGGSVARISLSIWLAPRIREMLGSEAFDIVHIHEPLAPFVPLCALCVSRSVNVGTFHAYHGSNRGYRLIRPLLVPAFKRLHGRIAVSTAALEMVSRFFPAEYQVIPNGIDLEHFAADVPPLPEFADGKLNILFVGRKEKRKGLRILLEAYTRLKREFPDIRLVVVGPGRISPPIKRFIKANELKDIVFTGGIPYSELPRYYRSADVFCAPNTGKESFGIVLLEAMATGKPIVASDIEGFRCVITHGRQGLLVPPRDGRALADALTVLLRNPALRQRMGERGRADAEEYDWKRVGAKILDYYHLLLDRHDRRAS